MAPLLELNDVSARYGQVAALHGVSLAVEDGEIVAILGANGAGKTTTLRAVSGMVRRSGEIVFSGKRLSRGPETTARSGIAHVPEGRGIFAEKSETRIWLSDDSQRIVLAIQSNFSFGQITLKLKDYVVPGVNQP